MKDAARFGDYNSICVDVHSGDAKAFIKTLFLIRSATQMSITVSIAWFFAKDRC